MPFQKGKSGNPKGKPPSEKSFKAALDRAIAQGPQKLRKAADYLLDAAAKGDPWAIKELADRLDGKPAQSQTIAGDPERPLQHKVEWTVFDPASTGRT